MENKQIESIDEKATELFKYVSRPTMIGTGIMGLMTIASAAIVPKNDIDFLSATIAMLTPPIVGLAISGYRVISEYSRIKNPESKYFKDYKLF